MGCGASRPDETALVGLCRQRMALIHQASEQRYALATAHAAYFNALAAVSDALLRFARTGHVTASPVVKLPSGGKGLDVEGSGGSSAAPLSRSLSEEGSHLHLSSDTEEEEEAGEVKLENPLSPPSSSQKPRPRFSSAGPSPNFYYMKSSTAIPTMVYRNPYGFSGDPSYYYNHSASPRKPAMSTSPPPTPPPPQGSAWDFLDLFSSYEQFLPGCSPGQYGVASLDSSPSSSEVRAREGIPDLEDEAKPDPKPYPKPRSGDKKGKMVAQEFEEKHCGVGSSRNMQAKVAKGLVEKEMISSDEKVSKASSTEEGSNGSSAVRMVDVCRGRGLSSTKNGVGSKDGSFLMSQRSEPSDGSLMSMEGTRDVVEVLEDIKGEFQSAINYSREVSKLLEVGKTPYRSRNKILRVISSKISGFLRFHLSPKVLLRRRRRLTATILKGRSAHVEFEKLVSVKSSNLSSTLGKLYAWEKKLYRQVKDEERLRAIYEKKCRRLESLDKKGADERKVNSTRVSARAIRTKMNIAVTSVDVISRRMHVIRVEELQPQLLELIQGLMKLWKFLLGCHQKQLRVILASGNFNLTEKTAAQDSLTKASIDLELKLLHWYACFHEWMKSQNSFVNALNSWLTKWLPKDHQGDDRMGVPPVYTLSNHWHRALNKCSESEVEKTIQDFAANMHKVWENQDDERRQNQKVESLFRGYSAKLEILQREHGNGDMLSIPENEHIYDDDQIAALDTMKKRLEEAKAEHAERVRQVQEISSGSLRAGLIPVLQSLTNYAGNFFRQFEYIVVQNAVLQAVQ